MPNSNLIEHLIISFMYNEKSSEYKLLNWIQKGRKGKPESDEFKSYKSFRRKLNFIFELFPFFFVGSMSIFFFKNIVSNFTNLTNQCTVHYVFCLFKLSNFIKVYNKLPIYSVCLNRFQKIKFKEKQTII